MEWMRRENVCSVMALVFLLAVGCGPEREGEPDGTSDTGSADVADTEEAADTSGDVEPDDGDDTADGTDGGEELNEKFAEELRRPVEVYTDDFGMKHIYAESLEDLFFMNGYAYASDRFGQMEFFRRVANGTLSEVLGSLSDETLSTDVMMRMLGLKRSAKKYWKENYDPNDDSFTSVEAFCRGVNAYLAERRNGDVEEATPVKTLFPPDNTRDWEPSDVMAVGRLLAVQLTYIADPEIKVSGIRDRLLDTYTSNASDPDLKAREGLLHDVIRFSPVTDTTHIDGFPDSGSALEVESKPPQVDRSLIENALNLHKGLTDLPFLEGNGIGADSRFGTGSNNWTLDGSLTASGHPNVANDPHLGLTLPSIFYPIHLELTDDIDGREPIQVVGGAILGVPGVVVGRNEHVAWGTTVGFYDYVDVYHEKITGDSDDADPSTVSFEGKQVEVEEVTETIGIGSFGNVTEQVELNLEVVPHHGPIMPTLDAENRPEPRRAEEALSVNWVGMEASNDYAFLTDLYRSKTPEDVEKALDHYTVGSSNFVFGFTNGDIFYSGQSNIPIRSEGALTYDAKKNPGGTSPTFILPGQGSAEWEGFLAEEKIPHAKNPEKGYIVTANNDQVGTTLDNNPLDDAHYTGSLFANGFRGKRITEMVENPSEVGDGDDKLSLEEQTAIQNDNKDLVAAKVVPHVIEAVDTVLDESVPNGESPDLKAIRKLVEGRTDGEAELVELKDLLDEWDYVTPKTRNPTGEDVKRSGAALLFNSMMVYLIRDTFADEFKEIGYYRSGHFDVPLSSQLFSRVLIWMLETPEEAVTWDSTVGDVLVFDDMRTDKTTETRLYQLVSAMLKAKDRLASGQTFATVFGRAIDSPNSSNPEDWVWGNVHGLKLDGMLPFGQR